MGIMRHLFIGACVCCSTVTALTAAPVGISSAAAEAPILSVVHPLEGQKLPALSQTFIFGAVTPGSSVTVNGLPIAVHPKGGYLAMVPLAAGDFVFHVEATMPGHGVQVIDRKVSVAWPFAILPSTPAAILRGSASPTEDAWLTAGDTVRASLQGSPGATVEFSIEGVARHVPMAEQGGRGVYAGAYVLQPGDKADRATVEMTLKRGHATLKEKAAGKLSIESSGIPRVGVVTDDTVAVRTGQEGGYDLFLYKGMRVRLSGKVGNQWRTLLSSQQSGWVKENAIQELPRGTPPAQSYLTNFTVSHLSENTLVRIPLADMLPYRTEQSINPPRLTITFYGAVDKTDLIKYDPVDPLVRQVRWRQTAPDTAQVVIEPTFDTWWGYDVRYEGTTLVVEVRKPWTAKDVKGMVIAVDAGHGGSDNGAIGPHGTLEKDTNLAVARVVVQALEKAGAKPFLVREKDIDVPLYESPRIAWNRDARLFVSVHGNASGEGENPLWSNGFSVYSYQPQSLPLARAVHAAYVKNMPIPDHGLYFADFAVCRMTQMPAILTEQAYIILPEQEDLLLSPSFHKTIAAAMVNGIKALVTGR